MSGLFSLISFLLCKSFREITISTNVHCIGTFNNKEYICIGYCMVFWWDSLWLGNVLDVAHFLKAISLPANGKRFVW